MRKASLSISAMVVSCAVAIVVVAALTLCLLLIGRGVISLAVVALLYLAAVGWSAWRLGLLPSVSAGAAAVLSIDYFFIPPFHTLVVGDLEGWQALGVFLAVACVVVGLIHTSLAQAQASEAEAGAMAELGSALASPGNREAIAATVVAHLQRAYPQAAIEVILQPQGREPQVFTSAPHGRRRDAPTDLSLPLETPGGHVGCIVLRRGQGRLPDQNSRLLRYFATQTALALSRADPADER